MKSKILVGTALVLLLLGVWVFYETSAIATRGGESTPLYSAERHDPYGTAALYDLLTERGASTSLARQPVPAHGSGQVLIRVLAGPGGTPDDTASAGLRMKAWLEEGNTVIEFTRSPTRLMKEYGLGIANLPIGLSGIEKAESEGKPADEVGAIREKGFWNGIPTGAGGVVSAPEKTIIMDSPAILNAEGRGISAWHALATNSKKQWVAAIRPVGNGRLIVVGSPTPVLNHTLGEGANLEFVTALIGGADQGGKGIVWFDEWSHGLGREGTIIGFIQEVGLLPVILQLLAVIVLYVWATSGYTLSTREAPGRRRSSAEQIETLGHLYSQSLKPGLVFEKVHDEIRRRIAGALRCAPAAIEAEIRRAGPEISARVGQIFTQLAHIGRAAGPACQSCGYDLTHNTSGKCPECGVEIDWRTKERLAKMNELSALPERQKHQKRTDALLAAALRDSHQFVKEHERDRNRRS